MKPTLTTPTPTSPPTLKKDPFQRLSLAVKQLDQLITRARQLGSLSDQLLWDDQTGPRFSSRDINSSLPTSCDTSTKLGVSEKMAETQGNSES